MSYAQFNTHLYYRRRTPGGFLEAGLSLPLYWVDEAAPNDEGEEDLEPALYGPSDAPVFVYLGAGWSTDASPRRTSADDAPATTSGPWTDNDVAQIAVMAPAVVRLDLVRWRFEALQVGLAHGLFGLAWNLRAQFGVGVAGVGGHWRATDDGAEEIGFMTWPLLASTTDDLIISYLNTQVYYRWSGPTSFTEAGLWVSPFWAEASLGSDSFKELYPLNSPGVSAYLGFGL